VGVSVGFSILICIDGDIEGDTIKDESVESICSKEAVVDIVGDK
jgi:hypothetical protein